ncbi:hypothetical protein AAVH_13966 [Aphelenchoides avenae]|nr:hypothetical protein AAVH_13966 [Aphelenchus avenae]
MSTEPPSFSGPAQAGTADDADNTSSDEPGNIQYWVVDDRRPQPEEILDWIQLPMQNIIPSTADAPKGPTNILALHIPTLKKTIHNYQLRYWLEQVLNAPPEERENDGGVPVGNIAENENDDVSVLPETPPPFYGEFVVPESPPRATNPEAGNDVFSQSSYKTAVEDDISVEIENNDAETISVSGESLERSEGPLSPSSDVTGSPLNDDLDASADDKRKMMAQRKWKRQKEWPYGCQGCRRRFAKSSTFMKHYQKYPQHRKSNAPILADKPPTSASELPPIDPAAELRRLLGYDPLSELSAEPLPSAL